VTAIVLLVGFAGALAHAGEKGEKEPIAIIELGGTGEWTFTGKTSFGPSAASPSIGDGRLIESARQALYVFP
jgi:hypothetical protein